MLDAAWPYIAALAPTVVVAAFFYAIIKRIVEADRRERLAQKQWDAAHDSRTPDASRPDVDATRQDVDVTRPDADADRPPSDSR